MLQTYFKHISQTTDTTKNQFLIGSSNIPIFDSNDHLIPTKAQIGIHKTITWRVRPWKQSNLPTLHQGAIAGMDNVPNFHAQDYANQWDHPMLTANAIKKAADTHRLTRRNPTVANFP